MICKFSIRFFFIPGRTSSQSRPRAVGFLLAGLFLVAPSLQAQTQVFKPAAEKIFKRGLEAYKQGHFKKSQVHMLQVLDLDSNQRSSAAVFLLALNLFKQKEYKTALLTIKKLKQNYPNSRYVADGLLLSGDCYFKLRRYFEASAQYGRILGAVAPLILQAIAAERLAGIVRNGYIDSRALENIRLRVGPVRLQEALSFGTARWYQRLGWKVEGKEALQAYNSRFPKGIFAAVISRPAGGSPGPLSGGERPLIAAPVSLPTILVDAGEPGVLPSLGVLLPLSGPRKSVGKELLQGIQLANEEMGRPFDLAVADTGFEYDELPIEESAGKEPLRSFLSARRLIEEEQVKALIGPVFSGATVAAAALAQAHGLPLIAPLAQLSGLDSLGNFIFQLNATPAAQGAALGQFAVLKLGLNNLALVAPLSDYGWSFEREFKRVVGAHGADLVYVDWYVPRQTRDFKRLFDGIRRAGYQLMRTSESGDGGRWSGKGNIRGGKKLVYEPELFIDSIEGVVIVVEDFQDAKAIAPQLHFHRLKTQILGNDIWGDYTALRQMSARDRRYLEGAVFVTGYRKEAAATRQFDNAFRRRFNKDPGYAAYGYDAARLIMLGWRKGHRSRSALRQWIAATRGYEGASGRISYEGGRRSNANFGMMRIDAGGSVSPLRFED